MRNIDSATFARIEQAHNSTETNVALADQYGSPVLVGVALAQYDGLVRQLNEAIAAVHNFQSRMGYGAAINTNDIDAQISNLLSGNGKNDDSAVTSND